MLPGVCKRCLEALPQPLESLLLAGQVNGDGLSLSASDVRARLREALRHLIVTPLRHLPAVFWKAVPPPPWSDVWTEQGDEELETAEAAQASVTWQTPPLLALGAQAYPNPARTSVGCIWFVVDACGAGADECAGIRRRGCFGSVGA